MRRYEAATSIASKSDAARGRASERERYATSRPAFKAYFYFRVGEWLRQK